jgi:hypothetical protein
MEGQDPTKTEEDIAMAYRKGSKVMVTQDNDNKSYDEFRGDVLIVTDVYSSAKDHPGYDESVSPQKLYGLKTRDGETIDYCLYDYELDPVMRFPRS